MKTVIGRSEIKKQVFMSIATVLAQLGTCDRKQVGCVIVLDGRSVSWGFNGAPPGLPHCEQNFHGWDNSWEIASAAPPDREDMIRQARERLEQEGCRNATHAEANALAAAARQGISTDGGSLFTTCSPCDTCSRLIIVAGIAHVYYQEEYRDRAGVELLLAAGITCERL